MAVSPVAFAGARIITTKYPGTCAVCSAPVSVGARVALARNERGRSIVAHDICVSGSNRTARAIIELRSASAATDADITINGLGGELLPFQRAGVYYIEMKRGRVLVADDMGLGKTIQALAWLQMHPELRPVIVICPASVKINWQREAQKWLADIPENRTAIVYSNAPFPSAPITLINYDIATKFATELRTLRAKVLVLDECQYLKGDPGTAKRAGVQRVRTIFGYGMGRKHVPGLAGGIPHILALSGTPIENRPIELWNTVHALYPKKFDNYILFAKQYAGATRGPFGWIVSGASNLAELQMVLRETCMVRRRKQEVLLELPDKRRVTMPMELTNRTEYTKAYNDLRQWLRDTGYSAVEITRKMRAEVLTRIEVLKQIAVRGKLEAMLKWIDDQLETDEKLIIFAVHRAVVQAVATRYNAPTIMGKDSIEARQKAVDAFQNDPKCRVIVCNLRAGGIGINLTAASNAVFLELGWTPAAHDQAEDRANRMGQKNAVTAWYLLAQNTIEEEIARLIDSKRQTIQAVLDAGEVGTAEGILGSLIGKLLA